MNLEVTFFGRINWTTCGLKTITVDEAIDIIKTGDYPIDDTKHSGKSCSLRDITTYIQSQPEETDLQTLKARFLPAVSFNGVYDGGIKTYSNITALDFDHIPSQKEFTNLYRRLMITPCVRNIFRTPSGKGLKALILHDNSDMKLHGNLYQQLMRKFNTDFTKTDPKCRDLSRRNYLCFDPDVWTNPSSVPYHFVYDPRLEIADSHTSNPNKIDNREHQRPLVAEGMPSDASVMNMLKGRCKRFHPDYLIEGSRRDGVFWFGAQSSKAGVDFNYGLDFVKELYQSDEIRLTKGGRFSEDEITENYTNGYDKESYDEQFRYGFKINRQLF